MREADRLYTILTHDLGLVRASASGVRKEESKLRGALEPLALSNVSLVRGKEYWRITSAESIRRIPLTDGLARALALLERLVQGESPHPELFDVVETYLEAEESILVGHILLHLGYLKAEDLKLEKQELVKAINDGLRESHLA